MRLLEFKEGHYAFLRVTPTTRVGKVIKSKKLTPKYIEPVKYFTMWILMPTK